MSSEYISSLNHLESQHAAVEHSPAEATGLGKGGKGIGVLSDITEGRSYLWVKEHLIALQPQTLAQLQLSKQLPNSQ